MLHTVNKSPFERNALESCLGFVRQGHVILLYEDGVYAALTGTAWEAKIKAALANCKICVLTPDLEARGMKTNQVIAGIQPVDYTGFVDLVVENYPIQAWL
jgi:tRNA 2-thiouridine synthesizing protein B